LVSLGCLVSLVYLVFVGSKERFPQKDDVDSKSESERERNAEGLSPPLNLVCSKMKEAGTFRLNFYTINS